MYASAIPVLPLVASTIVPPGGRLPSRSAATIIDRPIRSLTLPAGLRSSSLKYTAPGRSASSVLGRISGVAPTEVNSPGAALIPTRSYRVVQYVPRPRRAHRRVGNRGPLQPGVQQTPQVVQHDLLRTGVE